jgi:hypothetical protein
MRHRRNNTIAEAAGDMGAFIEYGGGRIYPGNDVRASGMAGNSEKVKVHIYSPDINES